MMTELDIVRDVSERLEGAGIAYMLTGSMAMNYFAQPRMTRDIDVVVALPDEAIDRIVTAFTPDYHVPLDAIRQAVRDKGMFNLIHEDSIIKVDCIVRKDAPYRRAEFERRQRIRIEDFDTWIVSKEDLIVSKLDWARDSHSEMQLRDICNLVASGCDVEYVDRWAESLELTQLWSQCRP